MANEGATQFGSIKAVLTLDKSDYVAGLKAAGVQADELERHDPTIKVGTKGVPETLAQLKAVEAASRRLDEAKVASANAEGRVAVAAARLTEVRKRSAAASNAETEAQKLLTAALSEQQRVAASLAAARARAGQLRREYGDAVQPRGAANTRADTDRRAAFPINKALKTELDQAEQQIHRVWAETQKAIGGVRTAEEGLAAVRSKNVEKTHALVAAEEGLAAAKRRAGLASARVTALERESSDAMQRTERSAVGAARSVDGMGSSFKGLRDPRLIVGGLAAAMALLGPVTGSATAALGGFIGTTATAILAWQGFKDEIEDGTALGVAMEGSLEGIKDEWAALGTTAAKAMSGDVMSGLREIRDFLPEVDDEVAGIAGHLGRAFNTGAKGTVSALNAMMPLLEDGGRYVEVLANKWATFAASQEFQDFVAYARRELPNVTNALGEVVEGAIDLGVALAPVGDQLVTIIDVAGKSTQIAAPLIGLANAASQFTVLNLVDKLRQAKEADEDSSKAITAHLSNLGLLGDAQSRTATALGTTDQALRLAEEAQRAHASSAAAATLQMQVEGDAAGLLKQQLDKLNGKALSVASTQNAFDSALANSNKHIAANGKTIDRATTSLAGNSAAAVANRGELIRQVQAAQDAATAMRDNGSSQDETRAKMVTMRDQIIANAKAHGLDTVEVQKFIDKIYKIPTTVPPTKLEVRTAQAMADITAFQKAINSLHGKTVTAKVRYAYTGKLPNGGKSQAGGITFDDKATGGVIGYAKGGIPGYAGGTLVGPGTGTSDSILAMVQQTQQMVRLSNGEFISTAASQRRNRAALEAGNKGATLTTAGGGGDRKYENHFHLQQTDPMALAYEQARIFELLGV